MELKAGSVGFGWDNAFRRMETIPEWAIDDIFFANNCIFAEIPDERNVFVVGVTRGRNDAAASSLVFRGIIKKESSAFITVGDAGRVGPGGRCRLVHEGMGDDR